jgi:glycosyltransferase involved in cell wall biosynthesis
MRLAHLTRVWGSADGGVAVAVEQLLAAQAALPLAPALRWSTPAASGGLAADLRAFGPDLLHVHGLWRAPNRLASRLQRQLPVVLAPHGMLDPWAFAQHHRRKTLLWWAYERRSLQRAAALHALCRAEVQALRSLGLTAPIALIPNGVALPNRSGEVQASLPLPCWAETIPAGEPVLLFLGRFHHKKGIQPLLQAWQSVATEAARAGWWLALVGYGDNGQLQHQLDAHPVPRTVACGPVFGDDKQAVLAAASAFVLPSYSEGLPMAALEAMAHQLPCLLSKACNLHEAFRAGAALPAELNSVALVASLRQLFALSPNDRAAMGAAGQALMQKRFSWTVVAEQTRQLYSWILGGGERPVFVELA